MKAVLHNYRQSPRKVRLVTELVKSQSVPKALDILRYANKRAAPAVRTLIASAAANAEMNGAKKEDLIVKNITVDKGIVMKRSMPRAMGSSYQIKKRTSHLKVELAQAPAKRVKRVPVKRTSAKNK